MGGELCGEVVSGIQRCCPNCIYVEQTGQHTCAIPGTEIDIHDCLTESIGQKLIEHKHRI
jgi:hypothetical protein